MIIVKGKLEGWVYSRLIDYLLIRCDVVTFKLPNFNKRTINDEFLRDFPDAFSKPEILDINNNEFIEYKHSIAVDLEEFEPFYINEYEDFRYVDSIQGCDSEIKIVKLNEELNGVLKAINGLYDWQYPDKPEDLCFFSKGRCFLRSVAHEKLCWIYSEDEWELKALKKMGLKFNKVQIDVEVPALSYELKY